MSLHFPLCQGKWTSFLSHSVLLRLPLASESRCTVLILNLKPPYSNRILVLVIWPMSKKKSNFADEKVRGVLRRIM